MDRDTELEEPQLPIFLDSSISQQTIRSECEGEDCLNATTRAIIPAGADRHVIHIAICPAMSAVPEVDAYVISCLLYTSPSPRDATLSRMPSSA